MRGAALWRVKRRVSRAKRPQSGEGCCSADELGEGGWPRGKRRGEQHGRTRRRECVGRVQVDARGRSAARRAGGKRWRERGGRGGCWGESVPMRGYDSDACCAHVPLAKTTSLVAQQRSCWRNTGVAHAEPP
eukprot:3933181-Rhodomonas_salina.1